MTRAELHIPAVQRSSLTAAVCPSTCPVSCRQPRPSVKYLHTCRRRSPVRTCSWRPRSCCFHRSGSSRSRCRPHTELRTESRHKSSCTWKCLAELWLWLCLLLPVWFSASVELTWSTVSSERGKWECASKGLAHTNTNKAALCNANNLS